MKLSKTGALAAVALSVVLAPSIGYSASVVCDVDAPAGKNYMTVPDTQVAACLDAGLGNIGNGKNDLFLNGVGTGYKEIADAPSGGSSNYSLTANGTGVWSFDVSAWGAYSTLAIGFKFGTGNTPDEWFVYSLLSNVVNGTFTFVDVVAPGASTNTRLSHVVLYGKDPVTGDDDDDDDTDLPEPGSLALLGLGLLGLGLSRRRKV